MAFSNPSSPIDLGQAEKAQARSLTYALLGRLYLEGVTAVTLPILQQIPQLAISLPPTFEADEAAADHHALFGFNVFPYESIFLDDSGLLGGGVTDAVQRSYQNAGFTLTTVNASPDHIGHELGLLAQMCADEMDARADKARIQFEAIRSKQHQFLQTHLWQWLIPFVLAVRQQERPFYTALADLTLEFVADHWQELTDDSNQIPLNPLTAVPPLLEEEKNGLKEIADYLTTPVFSGFYLSRDDIARLARSQNLPRGFGDRTQMLTNLMRIAAQFESLPGLLTEIEYWANSWQKSYAALAAEKPELMPFTTRWQERISQTKKIITQMGVQIKSSL